MQLPIQMICSRRVLPASILILCLLLFFGFDTGSAGASEGRAEAQKQKRVIVAGDCGADVANLRDELAAAELMPESSGRCFGPVAQIAWSAWERWSRAKSDGRVSLSERAELKKAQIPKLIRRPGKPETRIEIWRGRQLLALVRKSRLVSLYAISSGKSGYTTPSGQFSIFRKEEMSWSNPYSVWMPWASYFNGGIAFHQSDDVPDYPASHGCVRVPAAWAERVYRFADFGRSVLVL